LAGLILAKWQPFFKNGGQTVNFRAKDCQTIFEGLIASYKEIQIK